MSMQSLRRALLGAALYALATALPAAAQSAFPAKPVTLIVPFLPAAPPTATCASWRRTHQYLGQPVIVENRPGAGGTLGPANMARPPSRTATPFRCTPGHAAHALHAQDHWDPINDFTFIVGLSGYTFGFTVRADSPYRTFNDYIEAARKARQHRLRLDRRARRRTC